MSTQKRRSGLLRREDITFGEEKTPWNVVTNEERGDGKEVITEKSQVSSRVQRGYNFVFVCVFVFLFCFVDGVGVWFFLGGSGYSENGSVGSKSQLSRYKSLR